MEAVIAANNCNGMAICLPKPLLRKPTINIFPSDNFLRKQMQHRGKTSLWIASSKPEIAEVLTGFEAADAEMQRMEPLKTVHVRFQLQKECSFGEHFLLVGDDPMIGCWDPSNAIPLNWSDGHLWSVEMDIPVQRSIQFKYALKRTTGEILWQPGPDRVFQTWETNSKITITEDWESAEFQKMTEKTNNSENETVAEDNLNSSIEDLKPAEDAAYPADKQTINLSEFISTEKETWQKQGNPVNKKKDLEGAERIGDSKTKPISRSGRWRATTDKTPTSLEAQEALLTYEEGPVLVPGLKPAP
ncbi:uncharacterized protein LOC127788331 [Diospyros lotus]|uniref:uncharacterized protein LOC127788331 n=1 Tax=Diospyros lotus TaxID=55363 RepID=UPI002258D1DF|nr:uncharacterized protein LOC127788331 [Diospyros lotus]